MKLDPHEAFLRSLIAEQADITLEKMRTPLLTDHDLMVRLGTLRSLLDARDLTYIKRQPTPPSRSVVDWCSSATAV